MTLKTEAGRALLDDLAPIRSTSVGRVNDLEWKDREAFEARIALIEEQARITKIGVLAHDNGEFDSYIGYYDDPDRLRAAVEMLNSTRLDTEAMEEVAAVVFVVTVRPVPEIADDAFLDEMAILLEDAGVYVESASEAAERLAEEMEEAEEEAPIPVAPGQIAITDL